jgi:hypothetical protein
MEMHRRKALAARRPDELDHKTRIHLLQRAAHLARGGDARACAELLAQLNAADRKGEPVLALGS